MALYYGTKITGTSTTAKVFNKSGIKNAAVNDEYTNTETGHYYKCTTAGNPNTAKWKYIETYIVRKPEKDVTSLASPVRTTVSGNTRYMKASWKVPDNLTNAKSGSRAEGLEIKWSLITSKGNKSAVATKSTSTTTHQINLNSISIGGTTYTRNSFYPVGTPKLKAVTVKVTPYNYMGETNGVKATREFKAPKKPTLSAFTFNTSSNGTVSSTITTDAGTGYAERYDTKYTVKVYKSATKTTTKTTTSNTSTSPITASTNLGGYQALGDTDYIQVTVSALARGYAGDSETVSRTCYVSAPKQASISGKLQEKTERCVVPVKIPASTTHPVTGVRLQYLKSTSYEKATSIPASANWQDYDVQDDGNCSALVIDKATIAPSAGTYSWVRVKTWNWDENIPSLVRYSEPKRVEVYESTGATSSSIKIISTTAGRDGKSIKVQLAWNADANSNGTELSWSEDEDTWKSTKEPEEHRFVWSDGSYTSGGTTYTDSALITIKDLEPSTKYYIHARRYLEDEDSTTYSAPAITTCVTSSVSGDADQTAETIVAACNGIVPKGESLQVSWIFSSPYLQTDWHIVSTSGVVLAEGTGGTGSAQIPADKLEQVATSNKVSLIVYASSGSDPVASGTLSTTIVERPTISAVTLGTNFSSGNMTAQGAAFTVTASTPSDLMVIISSQGAVGQFPTGVLRQTAGDTIYSDIIREPSWTSSNGNYTTTVTLPSGLDFWDLGNYTLAVTAIDTDTKLKSEETTVDFGVAWANKAVSPFNAVTITPIDETNSVGQRTRAVDIILTAPTGSRSSDRYDIYRLTGDGAKLIGYDFPLSYTARDIYAPFGEDMTHYYRIAIRTVDGDVNFSDIEYVADADYLKFDWDGYTVDLPYTVSVADSYEKSVELRQHMDGSIDGYWNRNIMRRGSLSTDVIKLTQQNEIDLVRQLARYSGAVFVRTPDGCAYEADVQVTDLSNKNKAILTVAFDATEIGITEEFMLPVPNTIS